MKINSVIFISLKVEELSSSPTIVVFFFKKNAFQMKPPHQKNSNKKLNTVVSIPLQRTDTTQMYLKTELTHCIYYFLRF